MKLQFNVTGKSQPDPFIFEDNGKFYLYVTAKNGVEAYSADHFTDVWKFEGIVCTIDGWYGYWAPSILRIEDTYYMYVSCQNEQHFQHLHVARADSPLGPFRDPKMLYDRFTIDSHVVQTEAGLFLWYAEDNLTVEKFGTRIFLDRLIDPYTPANLRKEVLTPSFPEEMYEANRNGDGRDWYTLEGPFWFAEGDWQYLMFSGGCFQNDTYHVGYAAANTTEPDLTKVNFVKHSENGSFAPVLIKNEFEEGTGHHSVLKWKGEYYAIYHGRDYVNETAKGYREARTARICKLTVKDGLITADPQRSIE